MFRKQNGFDSRMSSCENIENIMTCKFQIKRKCQPRIYSDYFTCVLPVFALEKRTNLIRICFVFLVVTDISGHIRKSSPIVCKAAFWKKTTDMKIAVLQAEKKKQDFAPEMLDGDASKTDQKSNPGHCAPPR